MMKKYLVPIFAFLTFGCDSSKVVEAKDAVKVVLLDPTSAKFDNVEVIEGNGAVCGEVNSKNGFGAYTGSKAFAYVNGTLSMEGDVYFASEGRQVCGTSKAFMNSIDRYNRESARTR